MFRGKWALVSGAASGIGLATARRLAREGAHLVLVDKDGEGLERAEDELRETAMSLRAYLADVTDRRRMESLAGEVHEAAGCLDLLVNNAGMLVTGGIEATALDDFERLVAVNLTAVVHASKLFVPKMRERGKGAIVNVASASGLVGFPALTAYATTKFAVVGLTLAMRGELGRKGVSVNAVCPGLVKTEIMKTSGLPEKEQEAIREILERHGSEADDVAQAILSAGAKDRGIVTVGAQALLLDTIGRFARNSLPGLITRFTSRRS